MIKNLAVFSSLLLGLAATASAQLVFTLTGTITDDPTGLFDGIDTIDFTWSTTVAGSTTGWVDTDQKTYGWTQFDPSEDPLVESFTFTNVEGTYVKPTVAPSMAVDAYENYIGSGQPGIDFTIGASRSSDSLGLTMGAYVVNYFAIQGIWSESITTSDTLPNINDFFMSYTAVPITFTGGTGNITMDLPGVGTDNDGEIWFSFDTLTITSAVPEPSTYAAFAGVAALGLAGFIRRRRKA